MMLIAPREACHHLASVYSISRSQRFFAEAYRPTSQQLRLEFGIGDGRQTIRKKSADEMQGCLDDQGSNLIQ